MSVAIAELRNIVYDSFSGGQFSLLASRLNSDAINGISANSFPNNTINLSNVAGIEDSADGNTFTVRGTGVDLPFTGMSVTIQFYLANDDAALMLTATGDSSWALNNSFPILSTSVAASFSFITSPPPQLHLQSHASGDAQSGMTFSGTLNLSEMTGGLASIVGRSEQQLSGSLDVQENGLSLQEVKFIAPISEHVNLGVATVDELAFIVGSYLIYNFIEDRYSCIPYIGLSAEIPFSAHGEQYRIPVAVEIADLEGDFRFSADMTQSIDATLHELSSLTNGVGLGSFIPGDFHLEDLIKMNGFFFDFNTSDPNLVNLIGVDILSASPWTIMHLDGSNRNIQVENISLLFRLQNPFGSQEGWLAMSGEFVLGSAGRLVMSAFYPDYSIGAYLKDGTVLRFDEIIAEFIGADADLPQIDVYCLNFNLAASSYSLNAEMDGYWPIGDLPLAIEEVRLALSYDGADTRAAAAGKFKIAGVEIFVSAQYLGADGGWQFDGSTGTGQTIPIGNLIEDLVSAFGSLTLPSAIADLTIEDLAVSFNTKTKNFSFACDAKFPLDDKQAEIRVTIEIQNNRTSYSNLFGGTITIGSLQFNLTFLQNQTSNIFVATYSNVGSKQSLSIKDFVAFASSTLAQPIPASLTIDLKDVIFAYSQGAKESKFLFGLDISTGINLSNLPLVGQEFPPDQTVSVDDLQLTVAFGGLMRSEVDQFNNLFPEGVTKLPAPDKSSTDSNGTASDDSDTEIAIEQGLSVSASMRFGGSTSVLGLPVAGNQAGGSTTPATTANASTADNTKWFALQKTFGPVYFEKVGVQYKDDAVWFLLTGSLSVEGLTLALDGLAVGSPLSEFNPQFSLHGIGIDYQNGPVEIGGAFLRKQVGTGSQAYDEYEGEAIIKTEKLTLTALGSYAKLDGHPSMFVYALLDYPIGGPAFCFVTGLTAGFGYNRSLTIPTLDQLAQFPLVAEAITRPTLQPSLEKELQNLQQYIPPAIGECFLAFGVKFTSFKMIDSFALLTTAFGQGFEIDILGMSSLVAPRPEAGKSVTPLAVVQMAIRARFVPDDGFLGISGELTSDSYILSRDCHLTGGFAFYSWFSGDHEGDFVQTLGGYHPKYDVPDHYPKVPRLEFNWKVDSHLSLKGDAYYALTPTSLMAGGHLQATWHSGNFKVWFTAGADFLVSWKPYHYDANISVNVRASYTYHFFGTHHLNVDVGADLHLWGPDFSGKAHIKLSIISFDVEFGHHAPTRPKAIDWQTFKESFLPHDADICGISIKDGLVSAPRDGASTTWVVNPKEFSFIINSVIPTKEAYKGAAKYTVTGASASFGIGSMEVASANLSTKQTVTIIRNGRPAEDDFIFTPVFKNVPTGMWGASLTPSLNGQKFITQTLAGFEIKPAQQPPATETADIARSSLQFTEQTISGAYGWQTINSFIASEQTDEQRRQAIKSSITSSDTAKARDQLLQDLGVTDEIDLAQTIADAFLVAPQVGIIAS